MKGFVKKSFVFVLSLLALSCSNMLTPSCDEKEESSLPDGYIEFKVDTKNDFSRMAVPRAFADGVYYRLKIYKAGDEDNCVYSKYQTTLSFTIPAPAWTGSSVVKLDMYCPTADQINTDSDGNTVLQKSTSDDSALDPCMTGTQDFNLKANTRVFNHTINLAFAGTEAGTIKLPVIVGGTGIKSCIIVPDFAGTDASKYITAEITSTGYILVLSVAPFSDHVVFYFFKDSESEYLSDLNEQIKKAALIYSDSITVFARTTTECWLGIDGEEKTVDLGSLLYSTFYVDGTNGDDTYGGSSLYPVKKLSTAIARCAQTPNGGTIYLKSQPGDTEKIVIDKSVKIENISGGSAKLSLPNIEIKNESKVSITGVKISKAEETGISVGTNCSLILSNVEVSGCEKGIYAENKCTVDLSNDSAVKNCTGYGIQLKNSSGILKISGTEVDAATAATSSFDSCDLYYPKGKVVRLNAPCSDVSKNDDILNEAFDAVGGFGNGSVLLLGKTTSNSVTWEIKENGISVTTGISGNTYTVKPVNGNCNVTIKRDSSASAPFALLSFSSSGKWVISNFTFEGGINKCDDTHTAENGWGKGGALYLKNGTFELASCSFTKNSAQNGGAVYIESGTVNLTACTIGGSDTEKANTANECGGGIYNLGTVTLSGGEVSGNKSYYCGAGVYNSGIFTMTSGTISGNTNTSTSGGGGGVCNKGTFTMTGGIISGNTATNKGGGLYQYDSETATFFMSGTAVIGDASATTKATSSSKSNYAKWGSGIYIEQGKTYIGYTNVTTIDTNFTGGIYHNYATDNGGGIFVQYPDNNNNVCYISGGTIAHNAVSSTGKGNGVYVGCILSLTDNVSFTSEADIYLEKSKYLTVAGKLNKHSAANPIVIRPADYTSNTTVLKAGTGVTLANEVGKFAVKPDGTTTYAINSDGCLVTTVTAQAITACLSNLEVNTTSTPYNITLSASSADDFATIKAALKANSSKYVNITLICPSLKKLPDEAFMSCASLVGIALPEGFTEIGRFGLYNCRNLSSLNLPSTLTSTSYRDLTGCTSLTSLTLPEGLETIYSQSIDYIGITTLNIPKSVKTIANDGIISCDNLTAITVDEDNPSFTAEDGVLYNKNKTRLICYPGGKGGNFTIPNTVTEIGGYAFYSNANITGVTIPTGVTSIGERSFESTRLSSITIPEGVTTIESGAFAKCSSLTSLSIPSTVTSMSNSPCSACTSLTSLTVAEGNSKYVTVDNVLFNKEKTKLICCAAGKTGSYTIPASVTSIEFESFKQAKISSVSIPDTVTSIGNYAFWACSNLESITIPGSVTSIGSYALWECSSLTSVTFADTSSTWKANNEVIDVSDPSENASNLKNTYKGSTWTKN